MVDRDPAARATISRIASNTRWARTADRSAATLPGRQAALNRFEKLVDPEGTLDEKTRAKMAANARSAWYAQIARKSHAARRANRGPAA
jgi:hypothetical protein